MFGKRSGVAFLPQFGTTLFSGTMAADAKSWAKTGPSVLCCISLGITMQVIKLVVIFFFFLAPCGGSRSVSAILAFGIHPFDFGARSILDMAWYRCDFRHVRQTMQIWSS